MHRQPRPVERLGTVTRGLRAGWLITGITLALLAGLEVAWWAANRVRDALVRESPVEDSWTAFRRNSSVLLACPWAVEYAREWDESLSTEWHPYVYWRRKPYRGDYVNIDERGIRRTLNPVSWDEANVRVFALGGSTMWGTGSRDEGTIASHLSRELNALGMGKVHVENLGESGYSSTQEMLQLYLLLRDGRIPHMAFFYDGFNDLHAAWQNGASGIPMNESHRRSEFNFGGRTNEPHYLRRLWAEEVVQNSSLLRGLTNIGKRFAPQPEPTEPSQIQPDLEMLAHAVVHDYLTNVQEARSLAQRFGFEVFFFWQPMLSSKERLSPEEEVAIERWGSAKVDFERRVNELVAAAAREHPYIIDLRDLFDDEESTTFLDYVHVGEASNARVAAEMTRAVARQPSRALSDTDISRFQP